MSAGLLAACDPGNDTATTTVRPPPAEESLPDSTGTVVVSPLADTRWQLVELLSMDDAQGTTRIADKGLYTMELNADGTVAMRLNCNRASGIWSARAGADAASGAFELGPLTVTRALCSPPSLDVQIARDAEYIRGYLLSGGRLNLSLMADGGIYVWEPAEEDVAFETEPDPAIEAAIRAASPDYTHEIVESGGNDGRARYLYSRIDLDGDGSDEVFVYLLGSFFCGTGGCTLQLFTSGPDGYSLVSEFPTTRPPVVVGSETSNGWRDIWRLRSGGGAPANYVASRFDGAAYVEAETIAAGDAPEGTRVLAGEFTFADGILLEPRG
jgi:hypothetical protein